MTTSLLQGKKGLITGIINKRSIAYGIAKTLSEHGAELAITYQNEIIKEKLSPIEELILQIKCGANITLRRFK